MKRLYLLLLIPFLCLGHFRTSDYRSGKTVAGDWTFIGSIDADSLDTTHLIVVEQVDARRASVPVAAGNRPDDILVDGGPE